MGKPARTVLWITLMIVVLLGLLWQFYPLQDAQVRIDSLPLLGDNFIGRNVPLNTFEKKFFQGVNVLKRDYNVGGQSFFVIVLDGTRNRHVVHDPYYCFRGMGWEILDEQVVHIPGGNASILQIEKKGVKKKAMFWFSNGRMRYISPLQYWWQATLRRLTLGYSGEEPVLVIVQSANQDPVDWAKLPEQFPQLFKI